MKYQRPEELPADMGGVGDEPDSRMREQFRLLEYAPSYGPNVLDIGMGQGYIGKFFVERGAEDVYGTGLEMESYGIDVDALERRNIHPVECSVEKMPFEAEQFDVIVASHILEHVPNMGLALQEIRRVLARGGWCYIFLPRYIEWVNGGHINTGWNLGQLIYVLLLNGFQVKTGHFIELNHSLCAFVQKTENGLPALRGDRGDIHILNEAGLFPKPVKLQDDGLCDGFHGDIAAVNWDGAEELLKEARRNRDRRRKILDGLMRWLMHLGGEKNLERLRGAIIRVTSESRVNPKRLE